MAYGQIDPARLEGEALRRWYLRSPAEIEKERRLASEQRYTQFFSGLRAANEAPARQAQEVRPSSSPPSEAGWVNARDIDQNLDGSAQGLGSFAPMRMAVAPARGAPRATPKDCIGCHDILPPLSPLPLPPPIGTLPLPSGGIPSFRNIPGSGPRPRRDEYPQCDMQYEADSEICRKAKSRTCWETAAKRLAHCSSHKGEVGTPALQFGRPGR